MPRPSPGLYDALVTEALSEDLNDDSIAVELAELHPDAAAEMLARHLFRLVSATLAGLPGSNPDTKRDRQVALTNALIAQLEDLHRAVDQGDHVLPQRLLQVLHQQEQGLGTGRMIRPVLPLRQSDLVVNGPKDLRIGREIQRELASADRVDILVSFVKWSGFVELRDALQSFCDRMGPNPPLRILTTTYLGATDHEALDALQEMGAQIQVSYDARRTRLHAKAWLFHRDSGFSTGVVGSSNLSHSAMRDGCEWNVRLSNIDNPLILRKFSATFEQYWEDPTFEDYDRERFVEVVRARRNPERDALAALVSLRPLPHQAAVLEALQAERDAGHFRNLVIAATGTGKTVIAALDYKRQQGRPSLLFVAHRREILEKSRATYRAALNDGSFGELLTGTDKPLAGRHVFASIGSLHESRLLALPPNAYDIVVVDEFHHSEAPTWTAVLEHLKPTILLGLTATPERTDGQSVLHWFDGRVAAESRLWDALDQDLLVPFQYFGVDDHTDLSQIKFRGGRYDVTSLERVYTADEHRAKQVLRAVHERVRDPASMRALGFCVSVGHAEFMAAFFNRHGLPAAVVTGETQRAERRAAVRRLASQEDPTCALFTVDVFNEGIDIPEVDTVLFLRPTESATLFLQQLGRGLRLHEDKSCLTVLDFIGSANRNFRFDRRFRALLGGGTRAEVRKAVEDGFPRLPSGCSIQLEETPQQVVLENIRRTLTNWKQLGEELVEDWPLHTFLERADVALPELYRSQRCFSLLRTQRGFLEDAPPVALVRALPRLLHVDDVDRLTHWRQLLEQERPPTGDPGDPAQLLWFAALGQARRPVTQLGNLFEEIWSATAIRQELRELFAVLDDRRRRRTFPLAGLPFRVHATYSRDEISAGLGELREDKLLRTQGGVFRCPRHRCDVFYVTLDKDEKDFTPTTLYNDYPLSLTRFHWESQSTTRFESDTGRRYRNPPEGWRILLFVRQAKKDDRGLTMPYLFLGMVRCVSAVSERPIQVVWELERPMPADWFAAVKVAAG